MVQERSDVIGLDSAILQHPRTWEASGHLQNFTDPLVECKKCHHVFAPIQIAAAHKCPDCGGEMCPPAVQHDAQTFLGLGGRHASVFYLRRKPHREFSRILQT